MLSQRTMHASLRRLATKQNALIPAAAAAQQIRLSTTLSPGESGTKPGVAGGATPQLIEQRLRRPVAPHLSIYQPQITWYGSITTRITGSILSGGFYIFGFGYLVQPLFGIHSFDSANMIAAFAGLSVASKLAIKFGLAWPFAYHSLNGVRHLVWDTGAAITNKQVQQTGWAVVGLSTVSAVGLALWGLH